MKEIQLTGKSGKGLITLIDDDDYERVSKFPWHVKIHKCRVVGLLIYAVGRPNGAYKQRLFLHRFILNKELTKDQLIDHIDRNTLNNQKSNLRIIDKQLNGFNTKELRPNNKSGYKGVSKLKNGKYRAYVNNMHKQISLGRYNTAEEAGEVAKKARQKIWDENIIKFDHLNTHLTKTV